VAVEELSNLSKRKSEDNIENKKKINDKEKELQKKDKEISELAQAEVLNKQKKVNDLGVADANFAFTGDKNIIKACATKQLLLTIRFLENDGNENGEFKLDSNKTLFGKISSAQTTAGNWSTTIKGYFEGKGSDLQARIKKIKEEESTEGIGLEVIRDAYEEMGETAVVEAIGKELKPETPTPVPVITKERLTELFGFNVDETLKGEWVKSDDKTLTEENINTIVVNDYSPSKTKYEGLMTYLGENGDDKGEKGYDVSDDDKKKGSWEKFMKKGAKTVIRTIIACERAEDLKKIDKDNKIVKEMMEDTDAGYDADHAKCYFKKERYGNPEDFEGTDKPTKEKLINYLHDKKLGNVQKSSSTWETQDAPNKNGDEKNWEGQWFSGWFSGNWRPWVALGGIVLVIAGLAAVIFWKNISEWWNGPAEAEGEDKTDEKEEENE